MKAEPFVVPKGTTHKPYEFFHCVLVLIRLDEVGTCLRVCFVGRGFSRDINRVRIQGFQPLKHLHSA